jgi:site-specific DNA recombinase
MTKVVGYARVSTEGQAESGLSLEAQTAKLRAYAEAMDLELVDVVVDAGVSAKTMNRPGWHRVVAMLEAGEAAGVLVAKLDRLTRSVRDLGDLVDRFFAARFSLLSVADSIDTRTAAGRLVLNVLGSVSQWEREVIVERTVDALKVKRTRGERTSRYAPIGYRVGDDGVRLVQDDAERVVLATVRALHAEGVSIRQIAARLAAQGITSGRTGRAINRSQVERMLRAEAARSAA